MSLCPFRQAINGKYAPIHALQAQLANAEKDLEFAQKLAKQVRSVCRIALR